MTKYVRIKQQATKIIMIPQCLSNLCIYDIKIWKIQNVVRHLMFKKNINDLISSSIAIRLYQSRCSP